ncbi:MAG: PIN domain-containing protein [Bacteroidota bacterium]
MKVFLDANVLVSVLNKEYPVFQYSSRVLSLADNSKYKLYTSPICIAIAFYFAEKKCGAELARTKINYLIQKLKITTVNQKTAEAVIKNKKIHDIEDGLQYYSAVESGCKHIVTEDSNDFYFSEIEVLNSKSFLENYIF